MSAHWHIGMEVVCVPWKASRLTIKAPANANMPEVGRRYTIRDIGDHGDVILLRLHELDNSHLGFAREPGFNTSGFRPIKKRATNISIFTALLHRQSVEKAVETPFTRGTRKVPA